LGQGINPAPVGGGELQRGAQRGGGHGDAVGFVEVDEDVGVLFFLLEQEAVGGADDVGFCVVGSEEVELLEGGVWTEEGALERLVSCR
jgi:hypothetical protein